MVTFDDLPVELALKIFSYLPQRCLPIIAVVSTWWKTLAFDASLWKEVCIDSTSARNKQHVRDILDRATMIRKLDISAGSIDLEIVASASIRFKGLKELAILRRALSHASMPVILRNCESLRTVVLHGRDVPPPADIRALEHLKCLKEVVASFEAGFDEDGFRQLCLSCPHVEGLYFNSDLIYRKESWEGLRHLPHLASLSISRISTEGLLHASKNCGNLKSLRIVDLWNENEVGAAQALQGFRKLEFISVYNNCGTGWFDARFRTPQEILNFNVPRLHMEEEHIMLLAESCREKLQYIAFSAEMLTVAAVNTLSGCKNLENISIRNLCGQRLLLSMLIKFPNLVEAYLDVVQHAAEAVHKLRYIVDVLDKSSNGSTHLELYAYCSSQSVQDAVIREVMNFKEFLALKTRLAEQHIRDIERQCRRINDAKALWPATEGTTSMTIHTSFPVISKTLKHLTLNVSDQ